jgi:hypothetical protein
MNPGLPRRLRNLWLLHRPRLKRALFPKPWPDFTEEEVVLSRGRIVEIGADGSEETREELIAHFPGVPADRAAYQGWFNNDVEYRMFAAFVFAHRNRDHPYAKLIRDAFPEITDQQIVTFQKGWTRLTWEDEAEATSRGRPA